MKTATIKKAKTKGAIDYYQGVELRNLLSLKGYNLKDLSVEDFTALFELRQELNQRINKITESVELLAKDTDHEPIPINHQMSEYRHKKIDGDNVSHERATKEFVDRKQQLEDVEFTGLKLNFMKMEAFRSFVGNMEDQFQLADYLLKK
jgi:hypothetical protein